MAVKKMRKEKRMVEQKTKMKSIENNDVTEEFKIVRLL